MIHYIKTELIEGKDKKSADIVSMGKYFALTFNFLQLRISIESLKAYFNNTFKIKSKSTNLESLFRKEFHKKLVLMIYWVIFRSACPTSARVT